MDPTPQPEAPRPQRQPRARSPLALTPEEVTKIGQRLYGRRAWMPRMAEALGVKREVVSRWSRGLIGMSATSAQLIRRLDVEHRQRRAAERALGT